MAGVSDVLLSDAAKYQYDAAKASQTDAVANGGDLSIDDFWKLMAAQLQYQDPMNPMSNSDMMMLRINVSIIIVITLNTGMS